jgi:hypothetical protein
METSASCHVDSCERHPWLSPLSNVCGHTDAVSNYWMATSEVLPILPFSLELSSATTVRYSAICKHTFLCPVNNMAKSVLCAMVQPVFRKVSTNLPDRTCGLPSGSELVLCLSLLPLLKTDPNLQSRGILGQRQNVTK